MKRLRRPRRSNVVKVDNSYRVRIPKAVRDEFGIYIGQELTVIARDYGLTLIPQVDATDMKGAFPEITIEGFREEDDRF